MMQAMLISIYISYIRNAYKSSTLSYIILTRSTNADDIQAELQTSLKSPLDTSNTYLIIKRVAVMPVFRTCS